MRFMGEVRPRLGGRGGISVRGRLAGGGSSSGQVRAGLPAP